VSYCGAVSEHYFTAEPASAEQRREITVRLAGRTVRVETAAGVFSADRIDPGTAVLLAHVAPPPPTGVLVDLGCGWGPLALELGLRSPDAVVLAVDVNERALDLVRRNAARLGVGNVEALQPEAAIARLADRQIDLLWSNPPIRIGKPALHRLLSSWLPRLGPSGRAELVVARNLGADSLQQWIPGLGLHCDRAASSRGFRVLRVQRSD